MQNALRIDLYFYSTPFCLLLCKLHTWQSRWSSFSIWFSHSIHDLQLCIKNNHWRGDFDYSKMKNCLILEDDLTVLYIWLIFYYCTWPPVLMSLGVLDLLRLKSVCPLGSHLNLDLVNHPLRDRESFQGVHMYTRVVPVTKPPNNYNC